MPKNDDRVSAGIVAAAASRLGAEEARALEPFLAAYHANVAARDLADAAPAALFAAALAHWRFAERRKPSTARVRAYNPNLESDGWKSARTVIEAVTDDMPFLVDSLAAELGRQGLVVHLVVHPIVAVRRDGDGQATAALARDTDDKKARRESFLRAEVTAQPPDRLSAIAQGVARVLDDVRAAVEDWAAMRARMAETAAGMEKSREGEIVEAREFLLWAHDNNFTFIGARDYDIAGEGDAARFSVVAKSGLGILRDPGHALFEENRERAPIPPAVRAYLEGPEPLMISKANRKSPVHRPVHLDAISIKRRDGAGRVVGERVFAGLFTSGAYSRVPRDIPFLRRKTEAAIARAAFRPGSHDAKALQHVLDSYPRDELFQIGVDDLHDIARGVLQLQERMRVALFLRRDSFERFMSALVYVPRDRYTTDLRLKVQAILERALAGTVATHSIQFDDSPLARLLVVIKTVPGQIAPVDAARLEDEIAEAARSWADRLQAALVASLGEALGLVLFARYGQAFSPGYRDHVAPSAALADIAVIDRVLQSGEIGLELYRPEGMADHQARFKLYHPGGKVTLSDVLPMLERMGLRVVDEIPNTVVPGGVKARSVMIHDFGIETREGNPIDLGIVRAPFHEAFRRVWKAEMDSDGLNALVIQAGLSWRQVVVLRAIGRYLRQAGIPFSQEYMEAALAAEPQIARLIVELFLARFDPDRTGETDKRNAALRARIAEALDAVANADVDRILRRFVNVVDSALRTNFFQKDPDGNPKPYLSFKLDSSKIEDLPLPRPLREIFVFSPRMEGIHLRFGLVARGGIRWSDRREDFRTEILGLVKAQQVKNAVIVPVGSKGGFVLKRAPAASARDAFLAEGVACYKTLIDGMLDLTDNLVGGKLVPPSDVVRADGDDPYLVVAADKGTATFSDIANGLSLERGFWLGDAFASGGSQGYDHKKMGITARGAWESVKRHFRELGRDVQTEDFIVVGVGDMSGDVFGNGMLRSRHIKLVGAFDHRHIFLDPDPDPAKTFVERERMFALPRSSWADYDAKLISKGGGIFDRKAKSIPLSPEARKLLGLDRETATPAEAMTALLKAPADLLWFGGIGTYVKAASESHAEAGDRANDSIRVNGADLRARAIGEGANLGVTQRGRIEYALKGGKSNTDSIDNSAGVDCSDHEVNIKILIDVAVAGESPRSSTMPPPAAAGKLDAKDRNALLVQMTDEVGLLVLRDNYLQALAISLADSKGVAALDAQSRLLRMLEKAGRLNRAVEFLPNDEVLAERAAAKKGLTRPENAILLSHAKLWLYDEILPSALPDSPYLERDLIAYFPKVLGEKYRAGMMTHRLRREIVATSVTNAIVNRCGATFVPELVERTGMAAHLIARAFVIAREVFALESLWADIEALDGKAPAAVQMAMLHDVTALSARATLWFLRHGAGDADIAALVAEFRDDAILLARDAEKILPEHYARDLQERAGRLIALGAPAPLARRVAGLVNLYSAGDVIRLGRDHKCKVAEAAAAYYAVGTRFRLGRLRAACEAMDSGGHWQKLAVGALVEEIFGHQLALADQVLRGARKSEAPAAALARWLADHSGAVAQAEAILGELWATPIDDLAQVAVASRQLSTLARAPR
ncbi:MAG: NAD-glutamate dehydrogenase [Rhodospirillales bacterium]|nr:NAD-glutamate dehydrogenase [Rhodospirillales bacterium]